MIALVEDCKLSALSCTMTLATSIFSFAVMIFSCVCIYRMWKSKLSLIFESLPMMTTLVQSTLQFVQNFFVEDIRILLSSQFIQAITFSFIAMSFTLLYFRTNILKPSKNRFAQRRIFEMFIVYLLVIIGLGAYVLSTLEAGDCEKWFGQSYYIPLALSGVSMFFSIVFGLGLYRKIQKEHSISLVENQDSDLVIFKKEELHSLLKKQIHSILITYFCTLLAQIALNVVRELIIEDNMVCTNDFLFTSVNNDADIFLFFFTIIEITPCLIVPYVFYYVPYSKENSIKKHKDLIFKFNADDDEEVQSSYSCSSGSHIRGSSEDSRAATFGEDGQINQYDHQFAKQQIVSSKNMHNNNGNNLYSDESTMNSTLTSHQIKQLASSSNGSVNMNNSKDNRFTFNPNLEHPSALKKTQSGSKKDKQNQNNENNFSERMKSNTLTDMYALDAFRRSDLENNDEQNGNNDN